MLRVITETDRQEALVEKEQEEYILESTKSGVGTIILNKGEIVKHNWERRSEFTHYARAIIEDTELYELIGEDFSFVEVKFIYSYENYEKFLTDRGVTV